MNKQILYGLYMFVLIYCTVAKILSKSFKNNAYVIYLSPIAVGIFVSLIFCYIYKEKIYLLNVCRDKIFNIYKWLEDYSEDLLY